MCRIQEHFFYGSVFVVNNITFSPGYIGEYKLKSGESKDRFFKRNRTPLIFRSAWCFGHQNRVRLRDDRSLFSSLRLRTHGIKYYKTKAAKFRTASVSAVMSKFKPNERADCIAYKQPVISWVSFRGFSGWFPSNNQAARKRGLSFSKAKYLSRCKGVQAMHSKKPSHSSELYGKHVWVGTA